VTAASSKQTNATSRQSLRHSIIVASSADSQATLG
jgi:hypothetical protein